MRRRKFLKIAGIGGAILLTGGAAGAVWLGGQAAPVDRFPDIDSALAWLDAIAENDRAYSLTDWPLSQVLEHCAQSVEFSLHGFPQSKPAWFQQSAGAVAFATFNRRGAMHHGLTEAIPGAPALGVEPLPLAAERLATALRTFSAHRGPLAPHFAYGALDKPQYMRAHLMHLANHAEEIALA